MASSIISNAIQGKFREDRTYTLAASSAMNIQLLPEGIWLVKVSSTNAPAYGLFVIATNGTGIVHIEQICAAGVTATINSGGTALVTISNTYQYAAENIRAVLL